MNARSAAAPLLIVALLLGGGHTMPATAEVATKTYTDSGHGISFRYPATWKAHLNIKASGYFATIAKTYAVFAAPDGSAALFDMVGDMRLAGAALKAVGLKLYKDGNTVAGPITAGRATIGKISFYSWSGTLKGRSGPAFVQTIYAGTGSAGTYYIGGAILARADASAKALQGILDSVSIR